MNPKKNRDEICCFWKSMLFQKQQNSTKLLQTALHVSRATRCTFQFPPAHHNLNHEIALEIAKKSIEIPNDITDDQLESITKNVLRNYLVAKKVIGLNIQKIGDSIENQYR